MLTVSSFVYPHQKNKNLNFQFPLQALNKMSWRELHGKFKTRDFEGNRRR